MKKLHVVALLSLSFLILNVSGTANAQSAEEHNRAMIDIAATPTDDGYYEDESSGPESEDSEFLVMTDGLVGLLSSVSQNYDKVMSDPRRDAYLNGQWMFSGSNEKGKYKDSTCSAIFIRRGVGVIVLDAMPGEKTSSFIFFSQDIPNPSTEKSVMVTLSQSEAAPQQVRAMNIGFDADYGALIFTVPSIDLAIKGMVEKESFDVAMNGKSVAAVEWTGGAAAKKRLESCVHKK